MGLVSTISVDFALLVQSAWSNRQLGLTLIYPMKWIKEHQPGPLAYSVLEHSRALYEYEQTVENFSQDIDPPCVTVIDLDEVAHPVAQNGYSAHVDFYGFIWLLIFLEVIIVFVLQILSVPDGIWFTLPRRWTACALHSLAFLILAICRGEDTLTLARQSNTSSPGCAVLLHRELSLILIGSESTVEAIAESSFHRPRLAWLTDIPAYLLCELMLLFTVAQQDLNFMIKISPVLGFCAFISGAFGPFHQPSSRPVRVVLSWLRCGTCVGSLLLVVICIRNITSSAFVSLQLVPSFILSVLLVLAKVNSQNYPIRTTKLIDTLGRPPVRKWQFNTIAAAATFQCLVLCRRLARPVESIDVLAYLDVIIPDQRDVWKAWKARIADRIVHQSAMSFTPTIPTFGDERQMQLRDLLIEAQSAHEAYKRFYLAGFAGKVLDRPARHFRSFTLADTIIPFSIYLICILSSILPSITSSSGENAP